MKILKPRLVSGFVIRDSDFNQPGRTARKYLPVWLCGHATTCSGVP
jgi:hypothetical protein